MPRPLAAALAAGSLLTLGLVLQSARAQTLPSGLNVVHGQARLTTSANTLTVTNSPGAVLNWNTFSIGAQSAVRFDQASTSSQVLNRVTGNDPSTLLGRLSSNGKVWLLNPNGVLFGPSARVDVAGLVVSTLNLADSDWSAGRYLFAGTGTGSAEVVNQGELRTALGGRVMLVGTSLRNEGLIEAPGGQIVLAAGQSVELLDTGAPNLTVKVSAPQGSALNLGSLSAAGGRIDIQAALVNQLGVVQADSLDLGAGGAIVMRATQALNLGADSRTVADGGSGGTVTLDAGKGTTTLLGQVSATGSSGSGGQVHLLGRQVALAGAAAVDVSGTSGGGQVLVGGGQQGRDASVPNADAVFFGANARIAADATASGSGGRIILWSNNSTRAYGSLSVQGGPQGGDGGFIETSGGWLDAHPAKVDTRAARGAAGQWLIDPHDVLISDKFETPSGVDTGTVNVDSDFTASGDSAQILVSDITLALQKGTAVTISTGKGASTQAGSIKFDGAHIQLDATAPSGQLNVVAAGNITISQSTISAATKPLNINLQAGTSREGTVNIDSSTLKTNGGDLTVSGTTRIAADAVMTMQGIAQIAVTIRASTLDAGSGTLSVQGSNLGSTGATTGVLITGAQLTAGSLKVTGSVNGSSEGSTGVELLGSGTVLQSTHSVITADTLHLSAGTQLKSDAIGDAALVLVLTGFNGKGMTAVKNDARSGVLSTPNGRWLLYTTDPLDPASTGLGDLNYGFKQYGAVVGGAVLGSGNGLMFTTSQVALLTADVVSRPYDGSKTASATNVVAHTLAGDVFVGLRPGAATFATADAGVDKPVTISTVNVTDAKNRPVYGYVVSDLKGTVLPKELQLSIQPNDKVYDATTRATGTLLQPPIGLIGSETVTVTFNGAFADKNVGTQKPVFFDAQLADGASGGKASNYSVAILEATARITPAPLVLGGFVAGSRVYDGTTSAPVGLQGGAPQYTPIASDHVTVHSFTPRLVDKNVGLAKPMMLDGALIGADAGNYVLVLPVDLRASITAAPLAVTGLVAASKVYDGTALAALTGTALVSPLGSDSVRASVQGVAYFDTRTAGTNKSVNLPGGVALSGFDAQNYTVVAPILTASIAPAPLELGGLRALNKVYDSFLSAALAGTPQYTPLAGDQVSVSSGTARFVDKSVGATKSVALAGFALSGNEAGNYSLVLPTNLRADITPVHLSVNGLTVNDKAYDATRNAIFSRAGSVTALTGDTVTLSTGTAQFADRSVGLGKAVQATGFALAGADAGNYVLDPVGALSASITTAPLVLSGLVAANKVYDTFLSAALAGTPQYTPLASDQVSVSSGTAHFSDTKVGAAKSVALAGFTLSGNEAGNYSLVLPTNLRADITPAHLSVNGLTVNDKTYDTTRNATFSRAGSVTALTGDTVTLSTGTARFADKNAGLGRDVQATGFALAGADAGNYVLDPVGALSASITPALLGLSGLVASNKVYDSTTAATFSGSAAVQALPGDSVRVVGSGVASFADGYAGSSKSVRVSGLTLAGADAANYQMVAPALMANITAAPLRYLAQAASKTMGEAVPPLSGTVLGFVGADTAQSSTTGVMAFSSTADAQSPTGSYAVEGSGLAAANYRFQQAAGNAFALTVSPAVIPVNLSQVTASAISNVVVVPTASRSSASSGLIDAVQAPAAGNVVAAATPDAAAAPAAAAPSTASAAVDTAAAPGLKPSFAGVRLSAMSQDAVAAMLAQRNQYKKALFADAISKLEQNASLADLPPCQSSDDIAQGKCLLTDAMKQEMQAAQAAAETSAQTPAQSPTAPLIASSGSTAAAKSDSPALTVGLTMALAQKRKVKNAALPQIERKVALVIGVDQYDDKRIPQLSNAVNDARAVASLFESALGYETVVIADATKPAVVSAMNKLALELGPRDSVIVYYAGHGELVEATGLGYWQLADSDATLPQTWLSNADIGRMVAQIGASQVALISDSCYSGALVSDDQIRASAAGVDAKSLLTRKSVVVMSSGGNEPVADDARDGHSPFAWNLMNQLKQVNSWQAGGNVFARVRFAVARELPQRPKYGSSSAAGHQDGGDYLFERRQLEAAKTTQ